MNNSKKEILVHDYSLKRVLRKLIFLFASKMPMIPGKYRALLFACGGVQFKNARSCFIGINVYFDDLHPERISIGQNTIITEGTRVLSHFLDTSYDDFDHQYIGEVTIGNNVFVGMNTIFVRPVSIGDGAIIGANSVVTKNIESYTINGGNPAKYIKDRTIIKNYI